MFISRKWANGNVLIKWNIWQQLNGNLSYIYQHTWISQTQYKCSNSRAISPLPKPMTNHNINWTRTTLHRRHGSCCQWHQLISRASAPEANAAAHRDDARLHPAPTAPVTLEHMATGTQSFLCSAYKPPGTPRKGNRLFFVRGRDRAVKHTKQGKCSLASGSDKSFVSDNKVLFDPA